jgi:hypothetical protein
MFLEMKDWPSFDFSYCWFEVGPVFVVFPLGDPPGGFLLTFPLAAAD